MNVLRVGVILFLAFGMVFSANPASLQAVGTITLEVNGQVIEPDVPPVMRQGRVLVPIRWIAEALHADVRWDAAKRAVYINSAPLSGRLSAGSSRTIELWAGGKKLTPDVPPVLQQGRVLVSVRAAAEALGAEVTWVSGKRLVKVTKRPLEILSINSFQFHDPAGWGGARGSSRTTDEREKAIHRFLDRMTVLLKEAELTAPVPLEPPIRRMTFYTGEWIDERGERTAEGTVEFLLSADGAAAVVQIEGFDPGTGTRRAGEGVFRFDGAAFQRELEQLEAVLPDMIPLRPVVAEKLPDGVLVQDASPLRRLENNLPPGWIGSFYVDDERGEYAALVVDVLENRFELWTSENGTDWMPLDPSLFGNLQPTAMGKVPGTGVRLISSLNGGIYRSVHGSPWELVWEYPLPEAADKYVPIRYLPDPANPSRIYAAFDHHTRNPWSNGVFLSEDGGRTWTETGIQGDPLLRFVFPSRIVPDYEQDGAVTVTASLVETELYIGTDRMVVQSEDAGRSWTILEGLDEVFASAPGEDGTMYIGGKMQDEEYFLMTSKDGGSTWQQRRLPFFLYDVQLDPSAPELLFARGNEGDQHGLYISFDGGAHWHVFPPLPGTLLHIDAENQLLFSESQNLEVYQWEGR